MNLDEAVSAMKILLNKYPKLTKAEYSQLKAIADEISDGAMDKISDIIFAEVFSLEKREGDIGFRE
ncbi:MULTISPECIES: hypothetical protein [Desulfosporosinus]|uniref:Uncharacterized protein n=1 Tax=Desulfosporosinus acididurans TaxID=476652 RepID=A0A0J1FPD0_9FIRM|nr:MULTISPECIES: hypothetical protein [Desulfosporosinus]KLU64823.1 hypothetical protein DEAC_c31510 [Desulfosporosinus acididurans]